MTNNLFAGAQYHVMVDSDAYMVMSEFTPTSSNATSYQSEAALVAEFIRILTSRGHDYLAINSEQALIDNLRAQIETLNHMTFSDKEWKKLERMYLIRPGETIEFDSSRSCLRHKKRAPPFGSARLSLVEVRRIELRSKAHP